MPNLITPDSFDFFARYLLAGFILLLVRSWFVAAQRPKATGVLFDSVILSLLNQLIFLIISSALAWLANWLPEGAQADLNASLDGRTTFFAEVLILPTLLGLLAGGALAREWNVSFLRRFAAANLHPSPRAYDYAFANRTGPGFVIVTYKDGTRVFGYFGSDSLAATDAKRSDIYLERLYSVSEEGQWREAVPSRSALLVLDDVRSIEFLSREDDENV